MITFYVSIRPIKIEGTRLLSPKEHLKNCFLGIPLTFSCIGSGHPNDSRWLYEIETDTIEHRDVILEGLRMWGVHLKSLDSAKRLVERLTNIVWGVDTVVEKLIPPTTKRLHELELKEKSL